VAVPSCCTALLHFTLVSHDSTRPCTTVQFNRAYEIPRSTPQPLPKRAARGENEGWTVGENSWVTATLKNHG